MQIVMMPAITRAVTRHTPDINYVDRPLPTENEDRSLLCFSNLTSRSPYPRWSIVISTHFNPSQHNAVVP